jgi:hypothetical protein
MNPARSLFGSALLWLASSVPAADAPVAGEGPAPAIPRLVAFIGLQEEYEKLPCDARFAEGNGGVDEFGCGEDDYVYIGRYRVVEPLSGDLSGVVEFEGHCRRVPGCDRWALRVAT